MAAVVHAPAISVEGRALSAELLEKLTSARIERTLGLVGRTTLRFLDDGFRLSSQGTFGLGFDVRLTLHDTGVTLFEGSVTGVNLEQTQQRLPELVVTVDDPAIAMTRDTRAVTFTQMRDSDIVAKIAQQAGLQPSVTSTTEVIDYQLQTGTDLAFLDALSERAGMSWWVEGRVLHWAVPGASATDAPVPLVWGEDLQRLSVRASGLTPTEVTVTGWDVKKQTAIVGNAKTKGSAESDFVAKYRGSSRRNPSALLVADHHPRSQSNAETMATALVADASSGAVTARGTCLANAKVAPAARIKVTDAGPASGTYLVTSVEHVYNGAGFLTHFTAGPRRPAGLVDLMAGGSRPSPGLSMQGVVVGKVTAHAGKADPPGCVRVTYPTVKGDVESAFARVVTMGAGAARGSVFQPEVNDEVLVAFEGGDTTRPIVLGGLYSEKAKLPGSEKDIASGKVQYRRITSRLGHVIELADGTAPDEQHVLIALAGQQHRIRLGKDRVDVEAKDVPVSITNGKATVAFTAAGDVSIEGMNVSIKAKNGLTLEGVNVAVKASAKAGVEGAMVEVKAKATANVEAGGPLALKGAMVAIN